MHGSDRFLTAMVVGIALLVVVAFFVALRQPPPSYREPEDNPEAIAHNYLLAIGREDYERAYGYLAQSLPGRPASVEDFMADVNRQRWAFRRDSESLSYRVESAKIAGEGAVVTVRETYFDEDGLFDSRQSSTEVLLHLRREDGSWRLTGGDAYWVECWSDPELGRCANRLSKPRLAPKARSDQ